MSSVKANNENELKRILHSSTPNLFHTLKREVTFIEQPIKTELKTMYQTKIPSSYQPKH